MKFKICPLISKLTHKMFIMDNLVTTFFNNKVKKLMRLNIPATKFSHNMGNEMELPQVEFENKSLKQLSICCIFI